MADGKLKVPEKNLEDLVYDLTIGGMGSIPFIGSTYSQLFAFLVQSPYEESLEAWRQEVTRELVEQREKISDLSPEAFFRALQKNGNFFSIVMKATRIAIFEHQEEKREILKNVILNVAAGIDLEEDQQSIFLRFIEYLTPSHVDILRKQTDPMKVFRDDGLTEEEIKAKGRSVGIGGMWKQVFPEYIDNMDLYDLLLDDLKSRNLITVENTHVQGIDKPVKWGKLTIIGGQFVDFISYPA